MEVGHAYVNNHVVMTLLYHQEASKRFRVVGFQVEPYSVKHNATGFTRTDRGRLATLQTCKGQVALGGAPQAVSHSDEETIFWTYDVRWEVVF